KLVPYRQVGEFKGIVGKFGVVLAEKRQVEQPFTGVINDIQRYASAGEEAIPDGCGFEFDRQSEFGYGAGGFRAYALVDKSGDVILVLEARNRIVRLMFEISAGNATGFLRFEQGQSAAMDKIMDEGGDEDCLAGSRQARDAKSHGGRDQAGRAPGERVQGDARLVGKGCQRSQLRQSPLSEASDIGGCLPF